MMRNFVLGLALVVSVGALTAGCHSDDDGIKPEVKQQLTDTSSAAKRVDGNYDQLTDSEKKQFLDMANGDEAQAKKLVHNMAHPPNEAFVPGQGRRPMNAPPTTGQ